MGIRTHRFAALFAAVLVLGVCSSAWAWGPATHVKLAGDVLANLWALPASVGALLLRHRRLFLYGSVATDTVFAKKMSRVKQICHQWSTGFQLLDGAPTDGARAFALGYLSHLAADTVAHNKFLPRQIVISRSTVSFGHLYWEIRADSTIAHDHWRRLRDVLRARHPESEGMLEAVLGRTLLSFRTNQVLFRRMNLLASEQAWRQSVAFWSRLSRHGLDDALVGAYQSESLERILDVLTHERKSQVLNDDPNGNAAFAQSKDQCRQLRLLRRARIPHDHIVAEAARTREPSALRALSPSNGQSISA